jgi:AcrR family transcriptional regulator
MASMTSRTRNRRGEGGRLRDEIILAAERLLEREGSEEAISLRSVAREAGIAAPSIYGHFEDRDAILDAVLDRAFDRLRQYILDATNPLTDPVESLLAGCHAYVRFAMAEPARYKVLFDRVRTEPPASLDAPAWAARLAAFQTLVDGIADCAKAGRSASTDPFGDATQLWTAMHGAVTLRQFVSTFPWPPLDKTIDELVTRIARVTPVGTASA